MHIDQMVWREVKVICVQDSSKDILYRDACIFFNTNASLTDMLTIRANLGSGRNGGMSLGNPKVISLSPWNMVIEACWFGDEGKLPVTVECTF